MIQKLFFCLALVFALGKTSAQTSALEFLGTNEYVEISPNSAYNFGANDFTVEARVNFDDLSIDGGIFQAWNGGVCGTVGWGLIPEPNGRIFFFIGDGASICGLDGCASQVLNTNQCYHVAGVKSGTTISIYIDGLLAGTNTTTKVLTDSIPVRLGVRYANTTAFPHDGTIEEARMWNIARTASQIQSTMHTSLSGNEPGLVGYWPLDDGPGNSTVADLTIAGNNGTMVNMDSITSWVPTSCPDALLVPTVSQWGFILLALVILCVGAIAIRRGGKSLVS